MKKKNKAIFSPVPLVYMASLDEAWAPGTSTLAPLTARPGWEEIDK